MHLTVKQIELLTVVAKGNEDGTPCDLDEILDRIRYETTKQSLQFSIRALIGRGLIYKKGTEKRRGRQRQVIAATQSGLAIIDPKKASAPPASTSGYVMTEEMDELLSAPVGDLSEEITEGF